MECEELYIYTMRGGRDRNAESISEGQVLDERETITAARKEGSSSATDTVPARGETATMGIEKPATAATPP